jgi:hypothetical protein
MQFQHPFSAVVAGPSGSGKSILIKNILLNVKEMVSPIPHRLYWYYAERQPELENTLPGVEFIEGLPNDEDFKNNTEPALVVIDDFMSEVNSAVTSLFTKGSHHRNLSVFFLTQNFFDKNKETRTITLNAHYVIMFKNPRDKSQIMHLARGMYPGETKFITNAYSDATKAAYGYLLLDLKQSTPEFLRVKTSILPHEYTAVYVSKDTSQSRSFQSYMKQLKDSSSVQLVENK